MIKLNNKNITYVALADSNNSLKAPKEIWYADSNNSVKLVYRRKDALIEGEDYEKYHWLKGDGEAAITHKDVDTLEVKVSQLDAMGVVYASGYYKNNSILTSNLYIGHANTGNNYSNYSGLYLKGNNDVVYANYRTSNLYISEGEHIITKNTQTDQIGVFTDGVRHIKNATSDMDYVGTNIVFNQLIPNQNLYIGYLSSPNIHNLIPCKLLKPVPKWLDANGIRRQVGECGMIDLVSGKFYGNVNSVGTFTVENYYERKEWLQGRNGAYIDTMHPLTTIDDAMRVHAHYDGVLKNPLGNEQAICGVVERWSNDLSVWAYMYISTAGTQRGIYKYCTHDTAFGIGTDSINDSDFHLELFVDENKYVFKKNNASSSINNNNIVRKTLGNVFLFTRNTMDVSSQASERYFQGDIASFQIGDPTFTTLSVNMIPCTLTMDLPASMDANNIARTKGTSGMWDLVSDRFYGNVANSGTFKAVNLAEGVDYEVHDWLVGNVSTRIEVIGNIYRDTFSLVTIPTTTTNKRLLTSIGTTYDGNTSEYQIMVGGSSEFTIRHGIRINNMPTTIITTFSDNYINNEYEITTYRDGDYYYGNINGVEYKNDMNFGEYQFADEDIVINIYSNGFKLGNFNSGRVNLIPVKLLRSIPSKNDANGIVRQAGECGMYDTVNDVFYGNVASSGMFSVSDDS